MSVLLVLCSFYLLFDACAFSSDIPGDIQSCDATCKKSYPSYSCEKVKLCHLNICLRGCRFFNLVDFVDDFNELNVTLEVCSNDCKHAYPDVDSQTACISGCSYQLPVIARRRVQFMELAPPPDFFAPLLFAHAIMSRLQSQIMGGMSFPSGMGWSGGSSAVIIQTMGDGDGPVVVIRSRPQIRYIMFNSRDDSMEISRLDTLLGDPSSSATDSGDPFRPAQPVPRDLGADFEPQEGSQATEGSRLVSSPFSGWVNCVTKKTGLPRLLVNVTLLCCAAVVVWLCVTTVFVSQSKRQHVTLKPLSINGDFDYIIKMNGGDDDLTLMKLSAVQPLQSADEALPLPIKIRVEKI